jgi:hypothetical protein
MRVPSAAFPVRVESSNGVARLRLSGLVNTSARVRRIFELTATGRLIADTDRPPNRRDARPTTVTR